MSTPSSPDSQACRPQREEITVRCARGGDSPAAPSLHDSSSSVETPGLAGSALAQANVSVTIHDVHVSPAAVAPSKPQPVATAVAPSKPQPVATAGRVVAADADQGRPAAPQLGRLSPLAGPAHPEPASAGDRTFPAVEPWVAMASARDADSQRLERAEDAIVQVRVDRVRVWVCGCVCVCGYACLGMCVWVCVSMCAIPSVCSPIHAHARSCTR